MGNPLENFDLALKKMKSFVTSFDGSEVHSAGIIQAFEFTFEQCWKSIQKIAAQNGLEIYSPKKAFEWAFQAGWITASEEKLWLEILDD